MTAHKLTTYVVLITTAIFLHSCSNNTIVVAAKFPQPLVKKIPLTLGIVYEENFRNYHYEETSDERGERDWKLDMGDAQVALFNTILSGLFQHTVILNDFPNTIPAGIDAVFNPLIEDLQIAVPNVTKVNVFEVWIKYNLRVYSVEGDVIADWIMNGYGKTPTRFLKTQSKAITQATVLALRDSGANFVFSFRHVPEIRRWLAQTQLQLTTNTEAITAITATAAIEQESESEQQQPKTKIMQ